MRAAAPILPSLALFWAALASPGFAQAPQPRKAIDLDRFVGRWHEIAHTPNARQKSCVAGSMDWARAGAKLSVRQICRLRSGKSKVVSGGADVVDRQTNAKLKLSLMGGLIKQEYWVLDRADDYAWAVVGTPGGNYVWLLSKRPDLSEADRSVALQRMRALGYDTASLRILDGAA